MILSYLSYHQICIMGSKKKAIKPFFLVVLGWSNKPYPWKRESLVRPELIAEMGDGHHRG